MITSLQPSAKSKSGIAMKVHRHRWPLMEVNTIADPIRTNTLANW